MKKNRPQRSASKIRKSPNSKLSPVPQKPHSSFPIVGVGASAGGLEAFTRLLENLPLDTGMGFILVQHLDPVHESALTHLLAKTTLMPVREVTNQLRVKPNHVYVIPPNTKLSIEQGVLKLLPRDKAAGPHRSIDFFFESLAQDQRERAIGVILSGTASDGTVGLESIKAEGGIALAQDDSAKYDSMPRSAIAAGCVDFVLSPDNIAKELARIAKHPYVRGTPTFHEDEETPLPTGKRSAGSTPKAREGLALQGENGFKKILLLLRNHCGVDFSLYKSTTIQRRVTRRMVLNKQHTLDDYAAFLRGNTKELDALYSDVLISVTSFFRNPEAFESLKRKVFPKLIQGRRDEPVRIWTLGCSTGQEAYSIAISFAEFCDKVPNAPRLQIFATDLNDAMLDKARHGLYPRSLALDVSPQRLRRFFVEEEGGYRVSKALRENCVFARQNLISDPPFSRLDLISCRNVMIYLESGLQRKILPTFHYALKPDGVLFLGASESIGTFTDLFEPVDKKQKIFSKKAARPMGYPLPVLRSPGNEKKETRIVKPSNPTSGYPDELSAQREADRLTVNQFAPPSVLIDAELQILQFRGPTSSYLVPPTGKASFNILKMAREGLMLPLRTAINKAKKENQRIRREGVQISENRHSRTVNIEVIPLKNLKERCYLVLFEEASVGTRSTASPIKSEKAKVRDEVELVPTIKKDSRRVTELERELSETRDYLQSIQEQHEAANEELQASNEEVQSANEELQSINEELETSKEELESTNEELTTVNEEMANRNVELSRLNGDLYNLQNSINTAIVLVGRDLAIRRFTPLAEKMFNLLASDIGRSFTSIKVNFDFPELDSWIAEAIDTVSVRDREIKDKHGHWFSLRVRPYMTLDNKIDGAVLMLVDIDALKQKEREINDAHKFTQSIVESVPPILILDDKLRVLMANEPFYKAFQVTRAQTEGRLIYDLGNEQWNIPKLRTLLEELLPLKSSLEDFEVTHEFEGIGLRTMLLNARRLENNQPGLGKIVLVIKDITEKEIITQELAEKARLLDLTDDAVIVRDLDDNISLWNTGAEKLYGWTYEEVRGKHLHRLLQTEFPKPIKEILAELYQTGQFHGEVVQIARDGRRVPSLCRWVLDRPTKSILTSYTDITERKEYEQALRESQAKIAQHAGTLEKTVEERTAKLTEMIGELEAFSYSVSHDMRAPLRAMQNFASILLEDYSGKLDAEGVSYLERIKVAANRQDSLIQDVLIYSHVLRSDIHLEPIDLKELIDDIIETYPQINSVPADIKIQGKIPEVIGHPAGLTQCISNLFGNAIKFVAPGVTPQIKVRAEEISLDDRVPNQIRLWIEDNGVGIAPRDHHRIFRMFERIHASNYEGTGVGLAIVRKAIERMGGTVGVESEPGKGSRFWIQLQKA